ncbi:MAG: tRNA (adenosine(37)-N6)-threonylcarbamoyltransferase complex transferase subunit TsaD [Opitutaceae bacterium]|nr:tRNA (adenosine(37)-N6)-threonylcarbamoyltransferase complex transferase subunit TsaD [Opitutaceae bacterium]
MILALESSCDETAVALFDPRRGLVGEWVRTQMALHEKHGGVVPDLATREHLRDFPPMLGLARQHEAWSGITAVAVTQGPGLAACLAIGLASSKALSLALNVPVWGVNHLRAHAFSPFIRLHGGEAGAFEAALVALLPHLGLIVSGGNTLLVEITTERRVRVIATTRDDAAGEALDKGAKLLGLGYPGGPLVEAAARGGDSAAFDFPRGLGRRDNLEFSFSGLKTSLRYQLEKLSLEEVQTRRADLCASYQQAVVDALLRKLEAASATGRYASLGLSGGVANNTLLRQRVSHLGQNLRLPVLIAEPKHTGDNAGMIGFAAWADLHGVDRRRGLDMEIAPNAQADAEPASSVQV